MENQPGTVGSIIKDAGSYLETRLELYKLQAIDKTSDVTSSLVSRIAILIIGLFFLSLLNIGLALWIGTLLGEAFLGFFVMAGFYLLIALVLHFARNAIIKTPITNALIKKMLN